MDHIHKVSFAKNILNANFSCSKHGEFEAGSEENPFTGNLEIRLTGTTEVEDLGVRGIFVRAGGKLQLHGSNAGTWTRLARDIVASDEKVITLEVEPRPGLHPARGSQVVLASSDLDQGQTEVVEVVAVHNSTVWEVNGPLSFEHLVSSQFKPIQTNSNKLKPVQTNSR